MSEDVRRGRRPVLAAAGITLGVAGVIGYFVVALRLGARLPSIRNDAIPNWIVVGIGLALSALAVVRARRRFCPVFSSS